MTNSRLLVLVAIFFCSVAMGQTNNPYHLNGSASQENCNCYTLTPDLNTQSGSIWNINKINLEEPFEYKFNVFLGCSDAGADGIVFVLQPISTSVGSTGGGLGYENVRPSIGITIDTWQNLEDNDPFFDHIAIHRDGDIDHMTTNDLTGAVRALPSSDNIEDCQWHTFAIAWEPASKSLRASIDGSQRVSITIDLVSQVFNGDPMVFWGFTGATGGARNHQRVCTSLNPGFTFPANQSTCYPDPITFIDSSSSFGSILKWQWEFGDGTTDTTANPPPHIYPSPGEYEVSLKILGNNGCLSEPFKKKVIAGSEPVAAIMVAPEIVCDNSESVFLDSSYVEFGTVHNWTWTIDGQTFSKEDPLYRMPTDPVAIAATLQVRTQEGCVSDIVSRNVQILVSPNVSFTASDECLGTNNFFQAESGGSAVTPNQWIWSFGDGASAITRQASHLYREKGEYLVRLFAKAPNGCISDTVSQTVMIYGTQAYAGRDTLIAENQPLQLQGSGGDFFQWTPSFGLNDPSISNPVAVIQRDMSYVLTTTSPEGCATSDTINIKVFKGPDIYVPNAFTPNGDGTNDRLHFIPAGITSIEYFNVYNRYGQLIYRSMNATDGWDGTVNGKPQDSGTYVYIVRGTDFNGKVHTKKGTVTLIR